MGIEITFLHGIVIRQDALLARGISKAVLFEALEADRPLDESAELISFGPSFGQEACDEYIRRLESLGLSYVDDFFDLKLSHPDWLMFSARLI